MQAAEIPGENVLLNFESLNFTAAELNIFIDEIKRQFADGGKINLVKAANNARYLAKIDRALADDAGTVMTFADLEKLANEKRGF